MLGKRVVGRGAWAPARALRIALVGLVAVLGGGIWLLPTATAADPPSTTVTLTFDDGRPTQLANAFPALQSHGMKGTFFIISGGVGQTGVMTLSDLNTLKGAGMEIAGHSVLHPDLTQLDPDEVKREVCQGRNYLLQHGFDAYDFAYPYTTHNAGVEAIVAACGYNSGRAGGELGSSVKAETLPPANAMAIRTPPQVSNTTTLADLEGWVTGAEQNGGGWVPILFHDVCDPNNPATIPADAHCVAPTYVTPAVFGQFLDWLKGEVDAGRVAVKTVHDVIGGSLQPQVAPPAPPAPPSGTSNLLRNPSLEQADSFGAPAQCWMDLSNGATPATFTRTSDAHDGTAAVQIGVSSIEDWGFHALVPRQDLGACAPAATPGHVYQFSGWVKGNAPLKIWAFWLNGDGNWQRVDWGPAGQTDVTPTAAYTKASFSFTAPDGAVAVSVGFYVSAVGSWTVDDMSLTDTSVSAPTTQTLSVTRAGSGSGSVSSSPAGISCGGTCSASFSTGATVTLTATAGSGSTFSGWSGACGGSGTCVVTMDAAKSVTATFATSTSSGSGSSGSSSSSSSSAVTLATQALTVTRGGSGSGSVGSAPAGISCGGACTASFATGTTLTLTATADSGSTFSGWSGACSGTGTCTVSMDGAKSVTAMFATSSAGTLTPPTSPKSATLTKAQYLAKLRTAMRQSRHAQSTAMSLLHGRKATPAQVKAAFTAWGRLQIRLGTSIGRLKPPAGASKGNRDLARAERIFGGQILSMAGRLPTTRARFSVIAARTKMPTGAILVDRAIRELRAAGFSV